METIFNGVSLETRCFATSDDPFAPYEDVYGIVQSLESCKSAFFDLYADFGPYESFQHDHVLRQAVRSMGSIGFVPRLLTSAQIFSDLADTQRRFQELLDDGVSEIVLRL